jgi:hypothetical protein
MHGGSPTESGRPAAKDWVDVGDGMPSSRGFRFGAIAGEVLIIRVVRQQGNTVDREKPVRVRADTQQRCLGAQRGPVNMLGGGHVVRVRQKVVVNGDSSLSLEQLLRVEETRVNRFPSLDDNGEVGMVVDDGEQDNGCWSAEQGEP